MPGLLPVAAYIISAAWKCSHAQAHQRYRFSGFALAAQSRCRNGLKRPRRMTATSAVNESRRLAAILVVDVVGYSRLAGVDEDRTLARLRSLRGDLIDPAIAAHHGRLVKRTGDGSIIVFRSVVDAVRCATELQTGLIERNAGVPDGRRIEFRVGIHLGDVV